MKSSLFEYYKKKYGSGGKTPVRKTGMWYQDGDVVVPSNQITMKGPQGELDYFDSPIMGIGLDSGQTQVMQPGEEYIFPNDEAVYETQMQMGGVRFNPRLDYISPEGTVGYNTQVNAMGTTVGVRGAANIPKMNQEYLTPYVNVNAGDFAINYDPESLGIKYSGSKGRVAASRNKKSNMSSVEAGLYLDKLNLETNAQLEANKLVDFSLSGNYQVNPNLSLNANVNYIPGQGQVPNYNVGFRYSKTFQGGGMSIPGVQGTVVAAPVSLRQAYKKRKKK